MSLESLLESSRASARPKLGVSTYSFWHFKGPRVDILDCIDHAARMGFTGVEVLHQQMAGEENGYLQQIKRRALGNGIDLYALSIHQGFVYPDAATRQQHIDHTIHCIELAYKLGIPSMRLNTGRWNTTKSFDDLMANRGIEPAISGYTDEDGFKWVIESIEKVLPAAEKCGVVLGLENHWGVGRTAAGVMRIVNAVRSPWLGVTADTGNFLEDTLPQLQQLAPHAVLVHAKTYFGGGEWYSLELDYPRIAEIFRR